MKIISYIRLIVLFAFASSLSVLGQTNEQIENELVSGIKEIQRYSIYGGGYDFLTRRMFFRGNFSNLRRLVRP